MFAGLDSATKAIALDPGFARAYGIRARMEYNTITQWRRLRDGDAEDGG